MLNKYKKNLFSWQQKTFLWKSATFQNIVWLFFDRVIRMGIGVFVAVWTARYLGLEQFGILNYSTAFVALFNPLSNLGLDMLVIRSIVHEPELRNEILGTTFWLKLTGSIVCLLLTVSSIFALAQDDQLTVGLVGILATAGILQAFDTIDFWFQSQVQSKYTVVARNTAFITIALTKVLLIKMQAPLVAFAWATLGEVGLGALGLIITYRMKGYSTLLWRWSLSMARTLLKESWPLILSGLTVMIYVKIDQIMLGYMLGNKAVGLYSAATRISEIWYFIPTAISSSIAPSIYAAKQVDETIYYDRIKRLLQVLVAISLLLTVPVSFFSGTIIQLIFGADYSSAGSILAVHAWSLLFVFMGVGTSSWFVAEGLTQLSFSRTLMGSVANVILNLFLIPAYGGLGAAIATLISYAIGGFLGNGVHPNARKIFRLQLASLIPFK